MPGKIAGPINAGNPNFGHTMKRMSRLLFLSALLLYFLPLSVFANDGAFYMSGNHLVPVTESEVRLTKEVLKITRVDDKQVRIDVYYELYNPGNTKKVLVGFEASSPEGDVDGTPRQGRHPYMSRFSVEVNNRSLPYNVAIVSDSVYYTNGHFKTIRPTLDNVNEAGFRYVYHFNALFEKGKNIIRHSYIFRMSGSVDHTNGINYMLTTAKRWANKQIDDFTLEIDMGPLSEYLLERSFFNDNSSWHIDGAGKMIAAPVKYVDMSWTQCYVQQGKLTFHKENFKPAGELNLLSPRHVWLYNQENFPALTEIALPFSFHEDDALDVAQLKDEKLKSVFKNLPYARRGYVFKNPFLKSIFEAQEWYLPDESYIPKPELLTAAEQYLLKKLGK